MNEERLFRIIGDVDDDLVEEAATHDSSHPRFKPLVLRWGAVAACLALILSLGITRLTSVPQLVPRTGDAGITPFSSPMGMRKFFNYGGYRYAFLNDGAPYDLSGIQLTEHLGTLEHDILAGMDGFGDNEAATLDLATTFALGGELYQIAGYNPAFRLAVVWGEETYLAELVGRVDNQPLDAGYFLTVSDIASRIRQVEISPHMGGTAVATVKGAAAKTLVQLLAGCQPAQLAEEDYLAMADAQSAGQSWQLSLRLNDGTSVDIYLIPHLGLTSIGDSTYTLPAGFPEQWGHHFDGLTQGQMPLY